MKIRIQSDIFGPEMQNCIYVGHNSIKLQINLLECLLELQSYSSSDGAGDARIHGTIQAHPRRHDVLVRMLGYEAGG